MLVMRMWSFTYLNTVVTTKGGKGNNHIYRLVKGRHLDYLKQVMFYVDLERNYFYDQVR